MKKLKFTFDDKEVIAEMVDKNPKTSELIYKNLPFESTINLWGDEIYFEVRLKIEEENAREKVEIGDVAYWAEGGCVCIFFGKTPISKTDKPVAYSPVNVFAKVISNLKVLRAVVPGGVVRVESYTP